MSDQQLYFAIGVPCFVVLLGTLTNLLVVFWQAREFEKRLDARIDYSDRRVESLDKRLARIERSLEIIQRSGGK